MNDSVQIKAIFMEDDEVKYEINATNMMISASIEVYGYLDTFQNLGLQLSEFSSNKNERIRFQLGGSEEMWAYNLQFEIFCFDPSGKTAIKVVMNNNEDIPDSINSVFYLTSMPYQINELGLSLRNWNPMSNSVFSWIFKS